MNTHLWISLYNFNLVSILLYLFYFTTKSTIFELKIIILIVFYYHPCVLDLTINFRSFLPVHCVVCFSSLLEFLIWKFLLRRVFIVICNSDSPFEDLSNSYLFLIWRPSPFCSVFCEPSFERMVNGLFLWWENVIFELCLNLSDWLFDDIPFIMPSVFASDEHPFEPFS